MWDGNEHGEGGVWGICAIKCTILSPAAAFLGKGKLSRAIVVIPYLRSPSRTWCFGVGLATTEGSLGNAPCTWRIRDVSFLAVQRQSSTAPKPKQISQAVHSWKFYLQM